MQNSLFAALFPFKGVLQPKQVTVFTANFIKPPTVGVAIWIVRVWSPDTIKRTYISLWWWIEVRKDARKEDAFSPRIGSKIRINGLES